MKLFLLTRKSNHETMNHMIYISTFSLSKSTEYKHVYPYGVFSNVYHEPFVFAPITILYGDNGSGKSTILNIIARKFDIKGNEKLVTDQFDYSDYTSQFVEECEYAYGESESGKRLRVPKGSEFIKSQDLLYEVKKTEEENILRNAYITQELKAGKSLRQANLAYDGKVGFSSRKEILAFDRQKYSNGETALQIFEERFQPGNLYLLDEPEVSLSPQNQVKMAMEINELAHYCDCQFIIATHSPFLLGQLDAKIYAIGNHEIVEKNWTELENIRYFYDFFEKHKKEFE